MFKKCSSLILESLLQTLFLRLLTIQIIINVINKVNVQEKFLKENFDENI